MTTIATDGKGMACDGLVTDSEMISDRAMKKIRQLRDGRIVGLAGSAFDFDVLIDWLEDGETPGALPPLWEHSEALVLHPDGTVKCYNHQGRSIDSPQVAAIGSGMRFAMGAMASGLPPVDAVKIACLLDTTSGGEIYEIKLQPA